MCWPESLLSISTNAQMNDKISMQGGELVTSIITSMLISTEPGMGCPSLASSTHHLPTQHTVPLGWPVEDGLCTQGTGPLSSQAPSTPIYPAASDHQDLRYGNILQRPSLLLQISYVFKLSFTTTELQTSYIHFLLFSANWYVFFRTVKLRSGYNYRNPSYPLLPVSLMKPWMLCNFLIPNCLSVWQI